MRGTTLDQWRPLAGFSPPAGVKSHRVNTAVVEPATIRAGSRSFSCHAGTVGALEVSIVAAQDIPAVGSGISARHAAVVPCWLCGVSSHSNRMIPDGGDACDDVRWYCHDVVSCTYRWTAQAPRFMPEVPAASQSSSLAQPGIHGA